MFFPRSRPVQAVCCLFVWMGLSSSEIARSKAADEILDASGVRGGLIVHLGCADGQLTAAFGTGASYLVHGLDTSVDNIEKARKYIRSRGLYGKVAVDTFDGSHLPYSDNLVNLVVADDLRDVSMDEVMRVLAPLGLAYIDGKKTVKPWPTDIDEWTHYSHGSDNNPVAMDAVVASPRRLKWKAGPTWMRDHTRSSGTSFVLSAKGRVFTNHDEGVIGILDKQLGSQFKLTAQDAFNGVVLWKRSTGRISKRLIVADGDRLYVGLNPREGISVLDAATGKTLSTLAGTANAEAMVKTDKTLVVNEKKSFVAVDVDTFQERWRVEVPRIPNSFAAGNGLLVYFDGNETVALNTDDGKERWRIAPAPLEEKGERSKKARPSLLISDHTVILGAAGNLEAYDARPGKRLWTARYAPGGSMFRDDLFIAQGCVWTAGDKGIVGTDLATGEVAKNVDPSGVHTSGHHLRCYPARATDRFLITQYRGVEFISLQDQNHRQNDWMRAGCRVGVAPCNGLLYVPPHPCMCYMAALLHGFNALEGDPDNTLQSLGRDPSVHVIEKGPAYMQIKDSPAGKDTWPIYRHDARRSGATDCVVPVQLDKRWEVSLGGRLTPPVMAGGRLYVVVKDRHTVYALDPDSGKEVWQFTAGAGIDSPPTWHEGRLVFGCADGHVYCLRASDGVLAWRFQAAPAKRLIVDRGQLESAWRVHGSVPVVDDVVYVCAGRSSFLDGGLFFFGLDIDTGEVRYRNRWDTASPVRNDVPQVNIDRAYYVYGGRSDLMVAQNGVIYMNQMAFTPDLQMRKAEFVSHTGSKSEGINLQGKPYAVPLEHKNAPEGWSKPFDLAQRKGLHLGDQRMGLHLSARSGFLDDTYFNRSYWMYAKLWPGHHMGNVAPKTGQLLVVGDKRTYALQAYPGRRAHNMFKPKGKGYLLVADDNNHEPILDHRTWDQHFGQGYVRQTPPLWHQWIPIRVRAMVLTHETLFVAGPPDFIDPEDPMAAFEGRKGTVLRAMSPKTGEKLAELKMESEPVFDGLMAAGGELFISLKNGKVLCLGGE